ncbi:hypothetical protein [Rhodococcoides navarretei]|uniref:Ferredoxin n=1 Tax=Rhodococcus navarretei TaxID=3128981 RepID=A0ABU9D0W3_9NOCA
MPIDNSDPSEHGAGVAGRYQPGGCDALERRGAIEDAGEIVDPRFDQEFAVCLEQAAGCRGRIGDISEADRDDTVDVVTAAPETARV